MNSATAACLLRRVIVAQQSLRHGAAIERATRMAASKITKSAHPSSAATIIRFFGTPAEKVAESSSTTAAVVTDSDNYEKLVEANIKKLLSDDSQEEVKPISNEDLEIRLEHYKTVFHEAELCLSDLRETLFEADDKQYREETKCAEGAVNNAFTAYVDLLEDLQRSSEEQLSVYGEVRNNHACNLRRLRSELDKIIEVADNRVRASS